MDLLLVEDKDSFRRLLTQALEGSAWSVRAVADPQEALRALEAAPSHVLVTDLRLPGMSGLELIRRARQLHPTLRVVLMSAFGEPRDIVEAMRLGAEDFLPKPFDLDVFLAIWQCFVMPDYVTCCCHDKQAHTGCGTRFQNLQMMRPHGSPLPQRLAYASFNAASSVIFAR